MKKNIWMMNHYATEMYKNRAGRHFWFAVKLLEKGYKPTVFCANTYHKHNDIINTGKDKYKIDSVENIPFVFVKTTPSEGNGLDRIKNMVWFFKNLFSATKEITVNHGKPDVIIASSVHPLTMVAGIKIASRLKIPCICEVRDLWPEAIFSYGKVKPKSIFGRVLTSGEHWIYKKSDALIFTKEGDTDYIKEKKWDIEQGGKIDLTKCNYINNGVDLEAFERYIKENTVSDNDLSNNDTFNVIYTGAIRPVNNVRKLLDCAKILKKQSKIKFLIYGSGNQLEKLKSKVKDEKINNVSLKGHIDRKYIPYILSKSSVNVLNYSQTQYNWSRGNSSNKLFEYMASGKPIISTVKMGYSIIDKYKCGIELENGSPEDLANAILKIKQMPEEKYNSMGNKAKTGAKDFDFNVLTQKLINVIESVD